MRYIIIALIVLLTILAFIPKENINQEERELMARLVYLEAGTCGLRCQWAVGSVVLNLLDDGRWGDSIEEVIYNPGTFSVASRIENCDTPSDQSYFAVDCLIMFGRILPKKVKYFRSDYDHSWEGYKNYCVIDNVYFGYFTNNNH